MEETAEEDIVNSLGVLSVSERGETQYVGQLGFQVCFPVLRPYPICYDINRLLANDFHGKSYMSSLTRDTELCARIYKDIII